MFRPGGMLLYSTCTFFHRKRMSRRLNICSRNILNFRSVKWRGYEGFVNGMPQVTESRNEELKRPSVFSPHRMKGEGHFVALLQKGEAHPALPSGTDTGKPSKKAARRIYFIFKSGNMESFFLPEWNCMAIKHLLYAGRASGCERNPFLRTGLLLGELKKNRFEPSQAFAMCLKKDEYAQIIDLPCEDERVRRYLKGETLDVDDLTERKAKGWYLVCVDGFPLGWGKVSIMVH